MSCLKDKSATNLALASQLHDQNHYENSVHCAYYACLQLSKHQILEHFGWNEHEFNKDNRASSSEGSSHRYIIDTIVKRFNFEDIKSKSFYMKHMNGLKTNRNKCEYASDEMGTSTMSESAINLATQIIETLSKKP